MATPKTLCMRFYECEHHGDLDDFVRELGQCGATVLESSLDEAAEEALVRIEVIDFPAFKAAWQATDAADFATSLDWFRKEPACAS